MQWLAIAKDFNPFRRAKMKCHRPSSAFTLWVISNKNHNVIGIIMLPVIRSGQLRFLGSALASAMSINERAHTLICKYF